MDIPDDVTYEDLRVASQYYEDLMHGKLAFQRAETIAREHHNTELTQGEVNTCCNIYATTMYDMETVVRNVLSRRVK